VELFGCIWSDCLIPTVHNVLTVILMASGVDDLEGKIRDLAEREKECNSLFEEIKNGRGEVSLRYLALRDSCKKLRKEIFRTAKSAGLTRERIKQTMRSSV